MFNYGSVTVFPQLFRVNRDSLTVTDTPLGKAHGEPGMDVHNTSRRWQTYAPPSSFSHSWLSFSKFLLLQYNCPKYVPFFAIFESIFYIRLAKASSFHQILFAQLSGPSFGKESPEADWTKSVATCKWQARSSTPRHKFQVSIKF